MPALRQWHTQQLDRLSAFAAHKDEVTKGWRDAPPARGPDCADFILGKTPVAV